MNTEKFFTYIIPHVSRARAALKIQNYVYPVSEALEVLDFFNDFLLEKPQVSTTQKQLLVDASTEIVDEAILRIKEKLEKIREAARDRGE